MAPGICSEELLVLSDDKELADGVRESFWKLNYEKALDQIVDDDCPRSETGVGFFSNVDRLLICPLLLVMKRYKNRYTGMQIARWDI